MRRGVSSSSSAISWVIVFRARAAPSRSGQSAIVAALVGQEMECTRASADPHHVLLDCHLHTDDDPTSWRPTVKCGDNPAYAGEASAPTGIDERH
jgi:hypothetical protein